MDKMKKLTKQQRLEAYVYCYLELIFVSNWYICDNLSDWYDKKFGGLSSSGSMPKIFPELLSQKPKALFNHEGWFNFDIDGYNHRLRAIETCIRLCEQSKD